MITETKKCLICEKELSIQYTSDYCSSECGFKTIALDWDNTNALIAGLVVSDGNLSKDRARIGFVSKYKYFTNNFKLLVNTNNKITTNYQKGFSRSVISITDYALYNFLIEAGITPNKSLTINRINIPKSKNDSYFWLFLRGIIEGDGSIRDSVTIHSGSELFLKWIKSELEIRDINSSIYNSKDAYVLRIKICHSHKLYNEMYKKYENIKISSGKKNFNDVKYRDKEKRLKELSNNKCINCNKNIHLSAIRCSDCNDELLRNNSKIEWPSLKNLINKIQENNYSKLGIELGVSDNAIRKHLLKNGIDPKSFKKIL